MKKFIFCILFISLSACSQEDSKNNRQQINDNMSDIADLKYQINSLKDQVNQLSWAVSTLQSSSATFSPGDKGYSILHSNVGNFVAKLKNVVKYADGYKVTFAIGNPNLITYDGIGIQVHWGSAYNKDKDYSTWVSSLKVRDIDVTEVLLPGTWNEVTIVLSPAEEKEVGFISIEIHADQIYLKSDYRDSEN